MLRTQRKAYLDAVEVSKVKNDVLVLGLRRMAALEEGW
jgi:hypothetical protein